MPIFRLLILLFLTPFAAKGQTQDFAADMPFFLSKAALYQRWLDTTGLGKALRVETVRFGTDVQTGGTDTHELELYLLLNDTNPDRAYALWLEAQKQFERNSERPLMTEIFRTFAHNMEIPPAQGNVQIYVNDKNGNKRSGFFIWIWEENGAILDSVQAGSRSQNFEIMVPSVPVKQVKKGNAVNSTRGRNSQEVFDIIMALARELYPREKYVNTDCLGRFPYILEESRTENQLVFSVTDLCREALKNSEMSLWCKIAKATGWDKDCNDIKRERLVFVFDYLPNGDKKYRLKCTLTGKFGSGVYAPRTSGYMDMDPDFLSFERDYTLWFQNILKARL